MKIKIEDWRLTKYQVSEGKLFKKNIIIKENPSDNDFMLYQLGISSFLEEISKDSDMFRVTCYPASKMKIHHYPGNHEYLLSKKPMSADLLINLPKLKTHLKTGLTGALKNLVGINGNKEYLPHHRRGGPKEGGDCYPNSNLFRRIYDKIYDDYWENINSSSNISNSLKEIFQEFFRISSIIIGGSKIDAGSWSGNDTIWRTVLDLNTIIYFADKRPKHIISLVDGIICGEGDGPLKSVPKPLGVLIASTNPLLIDLLITKIIGYDYKKIPLIFQGFYHKESKFKNNDVEELVMKIIDKSGEIHEQIITEFAAIEGFKVPTGWENEKIHL